MGSTKSEDREIITTSDRIVIPRTLDDIVFTVTKPYENRLDLVSYRFYNTTKLWWMIATASNIYNPFDIPVGKELRVPPIKIAYKLGGIL